jgi:hypothetical protein
LSTFSASAYTASSASPFSAPNRIMSPLPISPTTSSLTETEERSTLCNTIFINKGIQKRSTGIKETLVGAVRPNDHFDFAVTEGTPALVGVAVLIDIDAAVHLATLEQDADKFLVFLRIHASPMTETAISR